MKRKPLEGIESLLFVVGSVPGYFFATQNYAWWVVISTIVVLAVIMQKLVDFLRLMNKGKV
ncbi:hypothetical protein IPN35_04805 [Candidatus Peregrinibacteria bacterium]|nr:MAG: hypothetical protein IPN35_04805 [Candidatus Peregrinibacteria bacterium]